MQTGTIIWPVCRKITAYQSRTFTTFQKCSVRMRILTDLSVLWKMLNVWYDGKFLLILQRKYDIIIKWKVDFKLLKLSPIKERNNVSRCWFCKTNKSVKYTGKVLNPCLTASNRYIDILLCNKCALIHRNDLVEWS